MWLNDLKQKTYRCWSSWLKRYDVYCQPTLPTQDETFKREIRSYGDLRCKATWEKAFAVLEAKSLWDANDDNQFLIEFYLIRSPKKEGWFDLVPQVLEQFIAIPGGLDCLRNGFEQILEYRSGYEIAEAEIRALISTTQKAARRQLGTAELESQLFLSIC